MFEELIDSIKDNFFLIGYGITLIISLVYYRRYFDTSLKYFPIIITYTFLNEFLSYIVKKNQQLSFFDDLKYSDITEVIYNIYAIIFFAFFYYVYWQLIANKKYRKWIVSSAILTLLTYVISCFYQNPAKTNLFYATAIGSWMLVFCIILYFQEKRQNKERIVQPYNLMFWVSLALLIFYTIFPVLYLIGYLDYAIWEAYDLRLVLRILIVVMYGLFIAGFLTGRRHSFR